MHIYTQYQLQLHLDFGSHQITEIFENSWFTWKVQKMFDKLRSFPEKPLDLGLKLKNYKVKEAASLTPQML